MHIYGKGAYPYMSLWLWNGLGGCRSCHSHFDHGKGHDELLEIAKKELGHYQFTVLEDAAKHDKAYRDYEAIEKALTELLKGG